MTYDDISNHINAGHYRASKTAKSQRNFQGDLFAFARSRGVTNEKALAVTYSQAYEIAHGSGYYEVLSVFDDLLAICQAYEDYQ